MYQFTVIVGGFKEDLLFYTSTQEYIREKNIYHGKSR